MSIFGQIHSLYEFNMSRFLVILALVLIVAVFTEARRDGHKHGNRKGHGRRHHRHGHGGHGCPPCCNSTEVEGTTPVIDDVGNDINDSSTSSSSSSEESNEEHHGGSRHHDHHGHNHTDHHEHHHRRNCPPCECSTLTVTEVPPTTVG